MIKVRKYMAVLLMFLMTAMLFGCGDSTKEIAVLLYDEADPFIDGVGQYLEEYNRTGYNVTLYDCKKSQLVQNELAERLYKEEVDLLVINPVERLSSDIFVEKSKKEDLPVIFFNREPLKEDLVSMEKAYYVGANPVESAIMQAEMIGAGFGNNPDRLNGRDRSGDNTIQCVILKGEQGHQDAEERTTGVIDKLEEEGFSVEVLETKICNWNTEEAYRNMEEIMETYGDEIELMISNNDAMAIGAVNYLKDHNHYGGEIGGVTSRVPFMIVGVDGIEEALKLIEKGYMHGTILNDGGSMAKAILDLSEYVLEESELSSYELVDDRYIWIPYKDFSND